MGSCDFYIHYKCFTNESEGCTNGKDQYSSIDDEMQLAKEGSEPSVVDDQHHERYYNEDTPEDDRRYESRGTINNLDNRYQEETSAELSTPPQRIRSYKNDEPAEDNGLGEWHQEEKRLVS